MSLLITLKATKHGKYIAGTSAEHTCAEDVILHWIKCNVYPMSVTGAYKKITNLFQEYRKLKKFSKSKSAGYWKVFNELSTKLNALFDIRANSDYTKVQENFWGVRMCTDDHAFYDDQKTRRLMSNTETIDIKWKKTKQRQMARSNRKRIETYGSCSSKSSEYQDLNHSFDENMIEEDSDDYEPDPKVRKGYEYVDTIPVEDDNMPPEYRYPRQGPHSVKLEIYQAMHIMKAKYHMSAQQIEGSLITIANVVFGRKWKPYCANEKIDNHSLPSMSNARRTERYAEAQVLNSVVEEMMSSESPCVVYSNDGSSQNGTGKYVVQSFTINGIQRTLPTLPVCTESKDTLKDLIIVTINMLSAATDNKYSIKQIFSKVNFVMTDSTAHNLGVAELVAKELEIEHVPPSLLCNAHPLLMMQCKIKELCQQIHDGIGKKRIKDCFMVDIDFHHESFVIKAIKCMTNFINRDCSSKPWNRYEHFTEFIRPKNNLSISLKDHRFNRLNDCALTVLYHLDDISAYLEKYEGVSNSISILDRTFVDMDILKPIFNAIALFGIHVSRPFHMYIMDKNTNYSSLCKTYPKLFEELVQVDPIDMMQPKIHVFKFISQDLFIRSLPQQDLLDSLASSVLSYPEETACLLKILKRMVAEGLHHQKGAIFSFGSSANAETSQNVLKFTTNEDNMETLDKYVPVHNIGEERNVGIVNYETCIRGKNNLRSVSQKVVIKKSADLLSNEQLRKYSKQARKIENLRIEWTNKMKALQKEGFQQQDLLNLRKDTIKLKDLEFLKT